MAYGYFENSRIIAPVAMRARFADVGAWHTLTDAQRAIHRWHPCDVINEGYNARTQRRTGPVLSFDGSRIRCEYTVTDKTPAEIRQDITDELAAHRYDFETGGIAVAGAHIKTDRESQAQLSAAYTSLKSGLIPNTDWKAANGFQTVTLAEIEPIAAAVAAHVRACFAAERAITADLDLLEDVDALAAFDVAAEFEAHYVAIVGA